MKRSLIDRSFLNNVFFSYGSQFLIAIAGFARITLITRYAGIDVYGIIATLTALSSILANLLTFRTNEAVVTFYKRGQVKKEYSLCRLALVSGLFLDAVLGGVLLVSVLSLSSVIATTLLKKAALQSGVSIFAFIMVAKFLRGTPAGLLVAKERFVLINSLNVAEAVLKLLILSGIVFSNMAMTLELVIYSTLIPTVLITGSIYFLPIIELMGQLRHAGLAKDQLRDYGRFTASTFLSSTLKAGNQNIDTILLGYLTSPAVVGVYDILNQFLMPLKVISSPFSSQITPRFVQSIASQKVDDVKDTIQHAGVLLTKISLPVFIAVTPLMIVYGQWNELNFRLEHYTCFALLFLSAAMEQRRWWVRSFSISTNPAVSVQAGTLSSIVAISSIIALASALGGLIGTAGGVFTKNVVVTFFWNKRLKEHV